MIEGNIMPIVKDPPPHPPLNHTTTSWASMTSTAISTAIATVTASSSSTDTQVPEPSIKESNDIIYYTVIPVVAALVFTLSFLGLSWLKKKQHEQDRIAYLYDTDNILEQEDNGQNGRKSVGLNPATPLISTTASEDTADERTGLLNLYAKSRSFFPTRWQTQHNEPSEQIELSVLNPDQLMAAAEETMTPLPDSNISLYFK